MLDLHARTNFCSGIQGSELPKNTCNYIVITDTFSVMFMVRPKSTCNYAEIMGTSMQFRTFISSGKICPSLEILCFKGELISFIRFCSAAYRKLLKVATSQQY